MTTLASPSEFEKQLAEAIQWQERGYTQEARARYEMLLQQQPQRNDLKYYLGATLLQQGFFRAGIALAQEALTAEPHHPSLINAEKWIGLHLFHAHYWETAESWLLEAIQKNPDDHEIARLLQRIYQRDYLRPDVFDPLAQQTLKRYSPREADTYVYTIDIVGTCNLRCPTCPVGNSTDELRNKSLMKMEMFESILDKIVAETPTPHAQIWLYSWGEPLLHPELPRMIKKIKEKGFSCHLSSNLNIEKGLKETVKAEPTELKISLSGFTQETYSETHAKGNLLLVKSNLYKLRSYMDQYNANIRVWVGHHLYKNNYHQQDEVKKLCTELNFGYQPVQAFYQPLEKLIALSDGDSTTLNEPILNQLIVSPLKQMAFSKKHQQLDYDCELRFNQTVINADGSVAQCCCQYETKNMLGIQFLDFSHKEIERKKYENPICVTCRERGLDYAPRSLPESIKAEA